MIKLLQKQKISYKIEEIQTPFHMMDLLDLFRESPYHFYLDSGMDEGNLGRFSFMGGNPFLIFKSKKNVIEVISKTEKHCFLGDPFIELKKIWDRFKTEPLMDKFQKDIGIPFLGGGVGYFGYEMGTGEHSFREDRLNLNLPDCYFMFVRSVLISDHLSNKKYISIVSSEETDEKAQRKTEQQLNRLKSRIMKLEKKIISSPPPSFFPTKITGELEVHSGIKKEDYLKKIGKIKDYIYSGHAYEVCLTNRFEAKFRGSPYFLYKNLRQISPAPFAGFLAFPEVKVISSSPERFLKIGKNGWAESRPIKGTSQRGKNMMEDAALKKKFLNNPKERAENLMIVDLVRNDFGKVCENRTIQVSELFKIESYSTLFQMVSTITGKLRNGAHPIDLIRACFPGGSMTGAPKIRAMEIIQELEPAERGIYSGAIGYLNILGNLDLNMVIRTIILKDDHVYFHAGGAIVADSDPEKEYQETLVKAKAIIMALRLAEKSIQ